MQGLSSPLIEPFLLRAVVAGVGIAVIAGALGCFIVWRRMAYFGDTLSHASLTGLALGALAGIDLTAAMILVCAMIGIILFLLQYQRRIPTDTLLGVLAHSSLAVGLIAISFVQSVRVDLMAYLFGDILSITEIDLIWIYVGGGVVLGTLIFVWRRLIALTVNEDIARAERVAGTGVRLVFTALLAVFVAIAMKIAGILLVTALLIIPPAAARQFARSPETMAVSAACIGIAATLCGMFASLEWDTPSGASIVASAAMIFAVSLLAGGLRRQ